MRNCVTGFLCVSLLSYLLGVHGFSALPLASRPLPPTLKASSQSDIQCDVAVFGGGFGGLYTALALQRSNKDLNVVIVEPSDRFVFLPLLYDLTVGTATEAEVCPFYSGLLRGTGIRHIRATLDSIDVNQKMAKLQPTELGACDCVKFRAGVIAVGASPESILSSVEGALECAQPFYTSKDAKATRLLLDRLAKKKSRIAVVGGGFGGVELAASVQRRLFDSRVSLLSRGTPMAGTRAEPLVAQALKKLGVKVEEVSVDALRRTDEGKVLVERTPYGTNTSVVDEEPWDAVLWTAGSRPSLPDDCEGLQKTSSGRLQVDETLCVQAEPGYTSCLWALGDCAELPSSGIPKTASAAVQQAPIVAANVQKSLRGETNFAKFRYNEIGSLLTLGGPNAGAVGPVDGPLAPFVSAGLDIVDDVLNTADRVWQKSPAGVKPGALGLSIGSYGLGVEERAPGTIAGGLTGGIRRTVYAALMPTNSQRAVALVSAALSTATSLIEELADEDRKNNSKNE